MMRTNAIILAASIACALLYAGADAEQDKFLARNGGWLNRPQTGRIIRLVNRQTKVPDTVLATFTEEVASNLSLPVEIVKGEPGKSYAAVTDDKVGILLLLDEDAKCPLKMLAAPDDRFVKVNVAPLAADGASADQVVVRVTKELWRGLVYGLGGGNNEFPGCLMVPAPGLKELDAIRAPRPCPAPFNTMMSTAHKIGILPAGQVTYRQACREGWAPQPTNDFQKVIWDEVNAKPTKPLKIKFDKARGK